MEQELRGIIEYRIIRMPDCKTVYELNGTYTNNLDSGRITSEIARKIPGENDVFMQPILGEYRFVYFDNNADLITGSLTVSDAGGRGEFRLEWLDDLPNGVHFHGRGYLFGEDRLLVNYWE